ncbi:Transcriptional regulator, TetR family OS=Tsukamurella paurometabola (strain ATCC 8368 / DSM/ CCUG 35730 / CIP 100753 / JCM 10117 / KCTC 9821 / NBRC 16120/ NCIMB 702349 / NCTC 13040) OX=521096 GN=Tpau_1662 PE=4 SV=1 [Tsukamurella paurometabola]|uniref:Transcriptional regulator, TetR family n=1 Tax=Tsukamurella paurometabola (strain ATCC 8368 / DSM 20162 / CCUG 35730 / CIP 100753 / JCM 10117 / KCTC 9821 / NBRC 16120 / NCIMB 702349 / NCTC 13040) TaxID=521096 RepID=D5UYH5_TSUPD|nr:TetR/AcrR family transcriptional regulator C-terminal domain-containing protein [Tsukamurella paurometabola]ADG78282.1 transcriptional regulator, TetR family [Tsukamurella paurometabola DSM 20162]SUP31020.1 Tetracycline repressor protein class D [Tsukamurella paurometabola]
MALNRADVVEAALAVLDEVGIDGLTLRRIADRLEVKAPALYWHFASKRDLTDAMATELMRRALPDTPPSGDWRADLAAGAHRLRAVLRAHTDGARVFSGSKFTDIDVVRASEAPLRALVDAGFELRDAALASSTLRDLVVGFVIEEQEVFGIDGAPRPGYDPAARAAAIGEREYPLAVAAGPTAWGAPDERFADAVRFLIDGLAARRREGGAT